MKILAISAHPDDETIGAGGTLAKHVAAGDEVYWVVATQAYTPRWPQHVLDRASQQIDEVQEFFGIKQVFRLGFPTMHLNTIPSIDLASALQQVVDEVRPDVVYTTPRNDVNEDHRAIFDATLIACRPLPGSSVKRLLSYEIITTTRFGSPSGCQMFEPNVFVDISDYLETKVQAMAIFETELREFPHPRSLEGLRILCRERGMSVGIEAAECFELIREMS